MLFVGMGGMNFTLDGLWNSLNGANEGSVISKAFIGSDTISATVINSQVQDRSSDKPLMQTLNCGLPLA